MIVQTARAPDSRPHPRGGSAVAVLLFLVTACGCGCRPAVRVVPGTEGHERLPRIVCVSPSESRLIVIDTYAAEVHAIRAVELATGRRTDFDLKSLPSGIQRDDDNVLADLDPETDQSNHVLWLGERFAISLMGREPPYLVMDGNRMTVVPSRFDLFGPAPRPEDYIPKNTDDFGDRILIHTEFGTYWKGVPGRARIVLDPDAPRRRAADSALAAAAPRVRYAYDPKLEAIAAQRDSGSRRIVLRVPADAAWEGGAEAISPSPNGRYLAYVDSRRSRFMGFGYRHELFLADLATGRRQRIEQLIQAEWVPWSRDSRHVYFANAEGKLPMQVRIVDVDRLFGCR